MRIVSGRFRGHPLKAPRGRDTRPTGDRVREALFNILATRVVGAHVADLFAGTGAFGLEALSRGAVAATFFDCERRALSVLRHNIARIQDANAAQPGAPPLKVDVVTGRLPRAVTPGAPWDVVFMDPPWGRGLTETTAAALVKRGRLGGESVLVAEQRRGGAVAWADLGLEVLDERVYGDTQLTLITI